MLFNSFQFLLFFPIVTLIYWLLPSKYRWIHLLIASCIFYIAFIPVYILILFFTIIIDYIAGILIENAEGKKRKRFLAISIIANVGTLAFFKYYNFFTDNINTLLHALNISTHPLPLLNIILPIGLSFHTFQAMSYTIEVYRGNQKAERHLGIYALYVMFYPQLVAGPIERPQNLLPQFHSKKIFDKYLFFDGLRLMLWGFFKKVVVADRLAIYVSAVYGHPGDYNYLNLIVATLFFAIQIYCDFSGYSDIAIGSAKCMGFRLMTNFNLPFASKSITEFWRRWHISLSTWFSDYLFLPIITVYRNAGKAGVALGLFITFFLSGLWHGAGWTFIIFGLLHGIAMIYEFYTKKKRKKIFAKFPQWLGDGFSNITAITFVIFTWVFFRAGNLTTACLIIKKIARAGSASGFQLTVINMVTKMEFGIVSTIIAMIMTIIVFITERLLQADVSKLNKRPVFDIIFCSIILTFIVCFGIFHNTSFIYFQF
jgi:alginate O-acetyltransferase complex protein AlgI